MNLKEFEFFCKTNGSDSPYEFVKNCLRQVDISVLLEALKHKDCVVRFNAIGGLFEKENKEIDMAIVDLLIVERNQYVKKLAGKVLEMHMQRYWNIEEVLALRKKTRSQAVEEVVKNVVLSKTRYSSFGENNNRFYHRYYPTPRRQ